MPPGPLDVFPGLEARLASASGGWQEGGGCKLCVRVEDTSVESFMVILALCREDVDRLSSSASILSRSNFSAFLSSAADDRRDCPRGEVLATRCRRRLLTPPSRRGQEDADNGRIVLVGIASPATPAAETTPPSRRFVVGCPGRCVPSGCGWEGPRRPRSFLTGEGRYFPTAPNAPPPSSHRKSS